MALQVEEARAEADPPQRGGRRRGGRLKEARRQALMESLRNAPVGKGTIRSRPNGIGRSGERGSGGHGRSRDRHVGRSFARPFEAISACSRPNP